MRIRVKHWGCIVVGLGLVSMLQGCAHPLEKPRVAERFRELHGCEASSITGEGDRWIARGCGLEAHYVCVNKYRDNDDSALWGSDTCIEETSRDVTRPPVMHEPPKTATNKDGKLRVALPLNDGWVIAIGELKKAPPEALISYRLANSEATDCEAEILVDGKALGEKLRVVRSKEASEQRFKISSSDLPSLAKASRVSIRACESVQTLRAEQRERLSNFAAELLESS